MLRNGLRIATEQHTTGKMTTAATNEFISHAIFRMAENTPRIANCLDELSEEEVWQRPNDSSNSVGNLILHLCGNITQYIHSALGGKPDERTRDMEFALTGGIKKGELMSMLGDVVSEAAAVIKQMDETELMRSRMVQGFELSGIGIIMHVVEHYSYHTGQIAFWTKQMTNRDLNFYADMDLNVKNEVG